ncbi:hypothetical protein CI610_02252 [invertebrate metagenome]|uniref:RDD domain-containing protein n=1 Tax=invertebrate metagenome TaxID=1711999 RepID=A0A2H9T6E4_9ZZZZ
MPTFKQHHTSTTTPKENSTLYPASVSRRLAALFYDTLLIISLWISIGFINLIIQLIIYGSSHLKNILEQGNTLGGIFFYFSLFLATAVFFILFWTHSGQTPGMRAWRIKIQNPDDTLITIKQSLVRCLVAIPAIVLLLTGIFWCRLSRSRKSWQDITSGSQTIFIKRQK